MRIGSQGVFCEVQPTDRQRLEFLTKLGFLEILRGEARSREGVVLGRLLWSHTFTNRNWHRRSTDAQKSPNMPEVFWNGSFAKKTDALFLPKETNPSFPCESNGRKPVVFEGFIKYGLSDTMQSYHANLFWNAPLAADYKVYSNHKDINGNRVLEWDGNKSVMFY